MIYSKYENDKRPAETTRKHRGNTRPGHRLDAELRRTERLRLDGERLLLHRRPIRDESANVARSSSARGRAATAQDGAGQSNRPGRNRSQAARIGRRHLGGASGRAGQNRVAWHEPPNYWHRIIGGELVTSLMSNQEVRAYLASIGSKGGKISRRTLTPEQAKAMVRAREKKRRATKRALRRSNRRLTADLTSAGTS